MHSTSLYGLKLSVLRGVWSKALATDHRVWLQQNVSALTIPIKSARNNIVNFLWAFNKKIYKPVLHE